jgi:serine/threonine protein kinase
MLVMEYMDHGSLYHVLRNETMVLDGEILLPILRDIAQGVRFLHAASPKVIHGDLKAQNVLVDSRFRAKVADFGLSQKRQATGTLYWMAPELLRGESVNTTASDVYAFGIILCEVYSRQDPYDGESDVVAVLQNVIDPSISRRPIVPASCPAGIRSIMHDCLQSDPEKRPTFEELDIRLKRLDAADVDPRKSMDLSIQQSVPNKEEKMHRKRYTMLSQVFPENVQRALNEGRQVETQERAMVTIFYSDIADFNVIVACLPATKVSDLLDRLYNDMDLLSLKHDVFKVETIGDAYMTIANLVKDQADHTKRIAQFAMSVLKMTQQTPIDVDNPALGCVNLRIGFHAGPVVADVVGKRNRKCALTLLMLFFLPLSCTPDFHRV